MIKIPFLRNFQIINWRSLYSKGGQKNQTSKQPLFVLFIVLGKISCIQDTMTQNRILFSFILSQTLGSQETVYFDTLFRQMKWKNTKKRGGNKGIKKEGIDGTEERGIVSRVVWARACWGIDLWCPRVGTAQNIIPRVL